MKRIGTGISGLDNVLKGGIPEKNQIIVEGAPGTGKSSIAFSIVYNSAKQGIPSAFISLDERAENVIKNAKTILGEDNQIDELIKKGMLVIDGEDFAAKISTNTEPENSYSTANLVSGVEGIIKSINAEVVAIDSMSFLKLMMGKGLLYNKSVASVVSNLRRLNVTSVSTLDVPYYERERMKYSQELLLFDGVMALFKEGKKKEEEELVLEVVKMRGTDHERVLSKYSITSKGIVLK